MLIGRLRGSDCIPHALRVAATAPGIGAYGRTSAVHAPIKALKGVGNTPAATGIEELAPSQLDRPIHTGNTHVVVPLGADDTSTVRPVHVIVHGILAVGNGIEPFRQRNAGESVDR